MAKFSLMYNDYTIVFEIPSLYQIKSMTGPDAGLFTATYTSKIDQESHLLDINFNFVDHSMKISKDGLSQTIEKVKEIDESRQIHYRWK